MRERRGDKEKSTSLRRYDRRPATPPQPLVARGQAGMGRGEAPSSSASHMLAGAGAGFFVTAFLHPLDLIKTRMHVQEIGGRRLPHYSNLWHAMRTILRLEGVSGLYQGVAPNMFGSTSSWAMYMFLYNGLKAELSHRTEERPPEQRWSPSWIYLAAATASGTAVSLIMHPVFTIKTRLQLQLAAAPAKVGAHEGELADLVPMAKRDNYANGLVAARRILREEGLLSLYRGIGPSLVLVSHGSIQFLSYEHCKTFFGEQLVDGPILTRVKAVDVHFMKGLLALCNKTKGPGSKVVCTTFDVPPSLHPSSKSNQFVGRLNRISRPQDDPETDAKLARLTGVQFTAAAGISKVVATLVTYPYQVVRSILQQRAVVGDDALRNLTMSGTMRHLWQTERLLGFYRGIVPHILRSTPQASITLVAYEYLHRVIIRDS